MQSIYFWIILLCTLLHSCDQSSGNSPSPRIAHPHNGSWIFRFQTDHFDIPIRASFQSPDSLTFHNATETIHTELISSTSDRLVYRISPFQSYIHLETVTPHKLSGVWVDSSKTDYHIPFMAERTSTHTSLPSSLDPYSQYAVTFDENSPDSYPAIGRFSASAGRISGTFLTETGDYRFLEGNRTPSSISLSCFDGAHLFFFSGKLRSDSIVDGIFLSGNHYNSTWHAVLDSTAILRDPHTITTVQDSLSDHFFFEAVDSTGTVVSFDNDTYTNRLTIIQVFGSWCPNCLDEHRFYKDLHIDYADSGLQILPIAFERGTDTRTHIRQLTQQFEDIGLDYPFYIGGSASKEEASRLFPALSSISSFPTSVFIDSTGQVIRIHTGFYGPGTGASYHSYVADTRDFIEAHLPR